MRRNHRRLLGQPAAGDMNPLYGAALAGGAGTGAAIAARTMAKDINTVAKSELIGLGVGLATGVALMLSKRSRAAGVAGVVVALATNGLRAAEVAFAKTPAASATAGALGAITAQRRAAFGAASAERVASFGMATAQRTQAFGGSGGLGIVSPEVVRSLGSSNPVTFQGGGLGQSPVTFQGGGSIAGAYGATLYSPGVGQ